MTKLRKLSELLRDQTKWPDYFEWDYSDQNTCALGLAREIGLIRCRPQSASGKTFGLAQTEFEYLFFNAHDVGSYAAVTPEIVADRIDKVLAE